MTPPAVAAAEPLAPDEVVALPDEELRPPEKSGNPDADALAEPELPLAPALLACAPDEPEELLDGMEGIDEDEDEDDDDGIEGIDDELLLDDDDDGICGMLLEDCCDCCVDSHALSSSAATLRLNRIRVRGIFMFTDSNRRSRCFGKSQCLECTVIKTGSRHHYCVSDSSLSISYGKR